ncbi:MAG: 30S ribosomal protein S7 [Candidatus Gracilibacteria bacterium]|nr:30S ribosomal protein S7 [Candidatus Gracilibacteria bacterium]
MAKRSPQFTPANSTELIEKFINYVMLDGKKSVARRIFKDTLELIEKRGYKKPEETFERAVRNVSPSLEVKAKRVGGSVYQIPMEVQQKRQIALSFRWILSAARGKKGSPLSKRLADELIEACEGTGAAVKKKEDVFKMAQANKAFAHFARY